MPDGLAQLWDRIGGGRLMVVVVGLGAAAVIWGFAQWAARPAWVTLAQGIPMEDVARIAARLEEAGIEHKLELGGTVVNVDENDLARARVALASAGLHSSEDPGFELFDQPSWGMTDFTQRVNYRRALEGELERTIGAMRGVESARVHLALSQSPLRRRGEAPLEASVVLALAGVVRPDDGVVAGIASLVAGSVEGLMSENVRVLDDTGRLLSDGGMETSEGLSSRQLAIRQDMESYLETKALGLLSQVVGAGNASVQVALNLNFDRIDRTVEAIDVDNQMTVQEDRSEVIPGSPEQGASQVTSNATYDAPRSVETTSRGGARIERLTVAVLVNDREVGEGDQVTYQPRDAAELRRLQDLVANAVGVSPGRGDEISIASVPFTARPEAPEEDQTLDVIGLVQASTRPLVGIIGAALALVLALRVMSTVKQMAPAGGDRGNRTLSAGSVAPGLPAPGGTGESEAERIAAAGRAATAPPRDVPDVEVKDAALTARVVRAWMKEA